jgi:hypothetical protein
MATTILSGRQLILSVNGLNFSEQITSSAINFDTERLIFDTLAGKRYKYIDSNVTLDVEFLNDAGATPNSLYTLLFDGTDTAPDTTIPFIMTLQTGVTLTGSVLPQYPSITGSGADVQTCSVSLQVVGIPTEDLVA